MSDPRHMVPFVVRHEHSFPILPWILFILTLASLALLASAYRLGYQAGATTTLPNSTNPVNR